MMIGVIDVGTNTVLLLVASIDESGTITTLANVQRVIRVGEGIQSSNIISAEAESRLMETLRELTTFARKTFSLQNICVFGTSVFRRAQNAEEVVARVAQTTGEQIEILSGDDEARWTFRGAISGTSLAGKICVLDIGGGSTEVVVGSSTEIFFKSSVDLGVVVTRETFFKSFPLQKNQIDAARNSIDQFLEEPVNALKNISPDLLVSVAGTPTTLAALSLGLKTYEPSRVDGCMLSLETINDLTEMLLSKNLDELRALPCVDERRADVLPGGALILQTFMRRAEFSEMQVSDRGVRYGIAMREVERSHRENISR